jgi:hypothetical protein
MILAHCACKTTQVIRTAEFQSKKSVYSGIWNDIHFLPANIMVSECHHCWYAVKGKVQMVQPLDTSRCILIYRQEKVKKMDTCFFEVKQMPIPKVVFTPKRHGIQSDSVFFLALVFDEETFKKEPPGFYSSENKGSILSRYNIVYYDYRVIDKDNNVRYDGFWTNPVLDCPGTMAILNNMGDGSKLVVDNMSVAFPDGSVHEIKVDTIFLK